MIKSFLHTVALVLACALLSVVTACAQLGIATPSTFNQRVTAGYTTVQTVAESATVARAAGKLTPADVKNVVDTSRAVIAGLDTAQDLHKSNAAAGESKLSSVLAILTSLQTYLATQGVK